jgi:hypothetical protein
MIFAILLIVVLPYAIPGFNPVGELISQPVGWVVSRYFELALAISGR